MDVDGVATAGVEDVDDPTAGVDVDNVADDDDGRDVSASKVVGSDVQADPTRAIPTRTLAIAVCRD
jgi:hypothetical protein